jgi:hypothetical protein
VGFGREARRACDPTLPHAYRLHSLAACAEISQPIGFHATCAYLQQKVDRPWRSVEFLVPAVRLLESERSEQRQLDAIHATYRRRMKATGERFPRIDVVTPRSPLRWLGDEGTGVRYALAARLRHQGLSDLALHRAGSVALRAANDVLASPGHPFDLAALQEILRWARRRMNMGWQGDRSDYMVAFHSLFLLGQVHIRVFGPPTINTAWNFTPAHDRGA